MLLPNSRTCPQEIAGKCTCGVVLWDVPTRRILFDKLACQMLEYDDIHSAPRNLTQFLALLSEKTQAYFRYLPSAHSQQGDLPQITMQTNMTTAQGSEKHFTWGIWSHKQDEAGYSTQIKILLCDKR